MEADDEIEHDTMAGETTCVIVALSYNGPIIGAGCGDSGALAVSGDGRIDDLTEDHQRKRGLPVPFRRPALDGTLVVASDRLLACVRHERIVQVVGDHDDLDEMEAALDRAVRRHSGDLQDDVPLVVVRPI